MLDARRITNFDDPRQKLLVQQFMKELLDIRDEIRRTL